MTRYLVLPILASLSACATPSPPAIDAKVVETKIPVKVSCAHKADIPAEPAKLGKLPADKDARQAADLLGAVDLTLRNWGRSLAAMLQACAD